MSLCISPKNEYTHVHGYNFAHPLAMYSLKVLVETIDTFEFILTGVSTDLANALRRIMIAEIPTWAIEYVQFRSNTTVLHDEFISHALSLVPLTNNSSIDPDETIEFTLRKTAPNDPRIVQWTSSDMETDQTAIKCAIPKIPLIKATRGQQIDLKAIAKRGTGATHAKWSPVAVCTFSRTPDADIHFYLETVGTMKPRDIVHQALAILYNKLLRSDFTKKND